MPDITPDTSLQDHIREGVAAALLEDIGSGDLTAQLIPELTNAKASITAREALVLAGRPWVDEVFAQLEPGINIDWLVTDGMRAKSGDRICTLHGPSRALLTGERTALNFLQTLSGTATATANYVDAVSATQCRILDTRKTLPGLRLAQKYAVRCGGGSNHRIGLFDAVLIKENHIRSAGGIPPAIENCRSLHPDLPIEIEVETIAQLREALAARAERILLDNFSNELLASAVAVNRAEGNPPAKLEASGGISLETIGRIAETGVDFISVGAITKHVRAIDFSMRFE